MAYKKKSSYIPAVDAIKLGVGDKIDIYKDALDDDGMIVLKRSPSFQKSINESMAQRFSDKENELKKLKEELEEYDLDSKDVKKIMKKKKKKDKKKKKKKNKYNDSFTESLLNAIPDDMAEEMKNGKKKKKKKKKLKGLIIKERKPKINSNGEPKEKKDNGKTEVAQRFKEVEKITRENIQEIDETMKVVDERIKDILKTSDRVRGKDTALSNYIEAKTTLISTRQKAATDILSNRAKVYDIEIKKEKTASSSAATDAEIITRLFPGIAINGALDGSLKKHINEMGNNKDGKKKKKKKNKSGGGYEYEDDGDLLREREKQLMKDGLLEYNDYDKNIEYEGRFDIAIKKSFSTGEWKFIAVDKDGSIMNNIPKSMFPSKKTVQMKFDDEKDIAIDTNTNTAYRVYSVPAF